MFALITACKSVSETQRDQKAPFPSSAIPVPLLLRAPLDGAAIRLPRTHILKRQVNVAIVLRLVHIQHANDVLMSAQLLQELDLAERALRIRRILERIENLLQCDGIARLAIDRLPYDSVGLSSKEHENT